MRRKGEGDRGKERERDQGYHLASKVLYLRKRETDRENGGRKREIKGLKVTMVVCNEGIERDCGRETEGEK